MSDVPADPSGQPPPDEAPPVPSEVLAVATHGLGPRTESRKRVVIIGGGLAGLVAAYELKRAGPRAVVLEAQNRVGGRIYTLRTFAPGLYAEAGGMRIPRAHDLTLEYCDQFGLPLRPFVMGNPKGLVHIGGERMTGRGGQRRSRRACRSTVAERERGRTADDLWEAAIGDLREMVESEGDAAGRRSCASYDQYSLYEFLRMQGLRQRARSSTTRVMNFVEADMHNAVVEMLREDLGKALRRHAGDRRRHGPRCRTPSTRELQDEVRFGAEVLRDRPGRRRRHGPLQDRGRPVHGHAATTRSARCRSRCCARSRS